MPGFVESYYCENCLRDNNMVKALRKMGHDVFVIPMYMPLKRETASETEHSEIFFGGILTFLRLKVPLLKYVPRCLTKVLDHPILLKWAAKKQGATDATLLSALSLSLFKASVSAQAKELERLVVYLKKHEKPDVIMLSLVLFSGLSKTLKEHLQLPIICYLQDEDEFVDTFAEPYLTESWAQLKNGSKYIDAFFTGSQYFKAIMADRLDIADDKIVVIDQGIPISDYQQRHVLPDIPTIGFLSQVTEGKGFEELLDVVILLKRHDQLSSVRLIVAGNDIFVDRNYYRKMLAKIKEADIVDDVTFVRAFDIEARKRFFNDISLLCVPAKTGVSYGLYILESLASGVPVVEPNIGGYVEMIDKTGGGILYDPDNTNALLMALQTILCDRLTLQSLGALGRKGVGMHYDINNTIEQLIIEIKKITNAKVVS